MSHLLQAEEPAEFPYYPPTQPVPEFEPDQDGFIDPKAFYQKVKADAVKRTSRRNEVPRK